MCAERPNTWMLHFNELHEMIKNEDEKQSQHTLIETHVLIDKWALKQKGKKCQHKRERNEWPRLCRYGSTFKAHRSNVLDNNTLHVQAPICWCHCFFFDCRLLFFRAFDSLELMFFRSLARFFLSLIWKYERKNYATNDHDKWFSGAGYCTCICRNSLSRVKRANRRKAKWWRKKTHWAKRTERNKKSGWKKMVNGKEV